MEKNALRGLLVAHEPTGAQEAESKRRMVELVDSAQNPFVRSLFQPGHFTASAFLLSPSADEVLMILHKKLGRWLQPGGHVEAGDADIFAAAQREVAEEVGVDVPTLPPTLFDLDVHTISAHGDEPEHEHFDVRILFQLTATDFAAGEEVADARWVALDDIDSLETDDSVRRAVAKLRSAG